jgi:hypothetical protein
MIAKFASRSSQGRKGGSADLIDIKKIDKPAPRPYATFR